MVEQQLRAWRGSPSRGWNRVAVVSSDATPTALGAIDWTNRFAFRAEAAHVRLWAQRLLTGQELQEEGDNLVIHVGEMLSFVAFARAIGAHWAGAVVLYAGDNLIVKNWLQSRAERGPCRAVVGPIG